MSPERSEGIWRGLFDPSYTLTGSVGENVITTGVAVQIARASDKTLSPDRDSPSAFLNWVRTNESGEFGIASRYAETATRDADGVEANGRVPVTSTSINRSLSANWRHELSERSTLSADAAYEKVSYEGGAFTDYSSRSGGLRFGYTMSEQTTSFIRVSGNKYTPADGGPSSSLADATLGMNWRTEYWDWILQAGKVRVGGGSSDTQGSVEAHYAGQRAQLTLSAGRAVRPSGLGGFVKADHVRGGWIYALSEYTNMGADLERQKILSTTISGDTTSNTSGVWLDHELAAFWRIRTYVQRRTSQGGGLESAASNVIGLALSYLNPDF